MEKSFLIVGLGNPGKEYANTRHNIGFMILERLTKHFRFEWQENKKFSTHLAKGDQDEKKHPTHQASKLHESEWENSSKIGWIS